MRRPPRPPPASSAAALVLLCGFAAAAASPAPARLTFTYLTVAGWTITDGRHTVVIDPFFSRPADRSHPASDAAAVAAHAPARADLILVGHAHYDHALDAPAVARRTGAAILGSLAVAEEARAAGLAEEKIVAVQGGEDLEFDGFSVRVIPSLHSRIGGPDGAVQTFAYLVRMAGESVLVFDTANFVERELEGLRPDVLIAAPGYRQKIHDYSCRLVRALGAPRKVLVTHFDDHRAPLGTPLSEGDRRGLAEFSAELRRCSPGAEVRVPAPFEPFAF